uniref:Uncharacterized protein n=1 Tax=Panagrolaimus davidi TaxID=227884 RepID=A0A914Q6Q9_9BILA
MLSNVDSEKDESRAETAITFATPATSLLSNSGNPKIKATRKKSFPWIFAVAALFVILILLILLAFIFLKNSSFFAPASLFSSTTPTNHQNKSIQDLTKADWPPPAMNSMLATFSKAAIVSDNTLCSEISRTILLKGGNAIDAGIAASICIGGINGHSSGIGGGFIATIYDKRIQKCITIDASETAPLATNENTFVNNSKDAFIGKFFFSRRAFNKIC